MSSPSSEIFRRGVQIQKRTLIAWSAALVLLALSVVGAWPSMESSGALEDFSTGLSPELAAALGVDQIASAGGYLKGNLYAVLLPLLLGLMAVTATAALTGGDEEAGRLELLLALPVARRQVFLVRFLCVVFGLVLTSVLVWLSVYGSVVSYDMDVSTGGVAAVTLTVALLAVLHAGIAYAIVGFGLGRGPALGVAAGVLVVGYLLHGIAPMSDALEPLANVSPWEWALGSDPLLNGVPWGGVALLVAVSVVVVAAGTYAVDRRDIKNA
ncbi:ABC transporter permease subunit [Streptomyces cyaneofuscatus]|uniref:ABC transporter permease n=1 Tax=Streptomyces cyaneofuscatus TaxID=66883 RepID=A0ABZ1F523_9ACTN|nr:ABC transporter permease subunit [Streptomyces cyaneofuscatus]WSB11355.1 ABC transporter permease [Streptomyces cyaneofuscatus]WSD45111.1 ABC transporter permease [Streptomyces cyaneofuscatus]